MRSVADEVSILKIEQPFYLLIPSRFPPVALFGRISNDEGQTAIAAIESITNPRLRERDRVLKVEDVDTDNPRLQNWNHAPFTYRNPEGTRFFGPKQPSLELADTVQTALSISVGKRQAFLARTAEARVNLDMRVLARPVSGRFADFRHTQIEASVGERRSIGEQALDLGVDGLLYHPPERPSATCVAVLTPTALGRAIQGDHFRFVWDGKRVLSLYAFSGRGLTIDPEHLASVDQLAL
jgi:hypothetical protein